LAKGKVFQCKVRAGTEGGTQGSEEAQDQGNHRAMMHDGELSRPALAGPVIATVAKQTARMTSWRGTPLRTSPFVRTAQAGERRIGAVRAIGHLLTLYKQASASIVLR